MLNTLNVYNFYCSYTSIKLEKINLVCGSVGIYFCSKFYTPIVPYHLIPCNGMINFYHLLVQLSVGICGGLVPGPPVHNKIQGCSSSSYKML